MASVTGMPAAPPEQSDQASGQPEMEPLLGRPGDASQSGRDSIVKNLFLGTGVIAQFGIWLLLILVYSACFLKPLMLFTFHPLSMILSVFLVTQSLLILQPTHTQAQKSSGRKLHAAINSASLLFGLTGFVIIEYNKIGRQHFHAAHGYFGVISFAYMMLQGLVGLTMWALPAVWGGEERAKSIWKYHRWSGYTLLLLFLATVASATRTDYNEGVLHLKLWMVAILAVLVVVGVVPRIKKQKLGL